MEKLEWTTKKVRVKDLVKLEINPRKITEQKKAKLVESLEKFNLVEIPAVNTDLEVIGGNQRVTALMLVGRGDEEIDVRFPNRKLTKKEVKEYAIISNTHAGEFDFDILEAEFSDIDFAEIGFDINGLEEWEKLVEQGGKNEAVEDDFEVPPTEEINTDIVQGDLFEIGEHRLLCGDSTDAEQVGKLMNGKLADMVFTDPPYGNGSSGKYGRGQLGVRTILNDENFNIVIAFFNLKICDVYVFFLQWRTFKEALQMLENNNLKLKTIAVWDKKNAGLNGAGGLSEQWEAILVAGDVKYSRFGGNVFSVSREQKKRINSPHPHQKPIELLSNILEYFQIYNLLLDPFLGSGSTMVACHQLKRICYGMELEPKYCDVIVTRMMKLDNSLVIKRNGVDETIKWLEKVNQMQLKAD